MGKMLLQKRGLSLPGILILTCIALIVFLLSSLAAAGVITVGPTGDYNTIQKAIDAAVSGDVVFVTPGTYKENINIRGKDIVVRSFNPVSPGVVTNTVIDGDNKDSAVIFAGTETSACVLTGFTIKNGEASFGGGIRGNTTSATIMYNIITDNTAYLGGGIYSCNGLIKNNVIKNNNAHSESVQDSRGAGIFNCNGTIQNNLIFNNEAQHMGGGLYQCGGRIENNTIYKNTAGSFGGGVGNCEGTIENCIIWGNIATTNPQIYPRQTGSYCCVESGNTSLAKINTNPDFVDPAAFNLHLKSTSPCIDSGAPITDLKNDIDNDPRPINGTDDPRGCGSEMDMGADEYAPPCEGLVKPEDRNLIPPFDTFYLAVEFTYDGKPPLETFGFDMTFDAARLAYNRISTAGSLTNDWSGVQGNLQSAGRVRVGGFKGEGTPVEDSGNLLFVAFDVLTSTGGEFDVTVENPVDDLLEYCTGKGKMVIGAKGDMNEDGKITPADAQIVFEYYLLGEPFNNHPEADVNCDGQITPADANEILQHYLDPNREWPC